MSDIRRTSTHKCDWHYHNEPDGTCDCDWECTRCGQKWHGSGEHDSQKCADLLVQRLEQSLINTIHKDSAKEYEIVEVMISQAKEIEWLRERVRVLRDALTIARHYVSKDHVRLWSGDIMQPRYSPAAQKVAETIDQIDAALAATEQPKPIRLRLIALGFVAKESK